MACKRTVCATFVALALATFTTPVDAATGGDSNELGYMQYLRRHCSTLIGQFDRARPTQPDAIALRKRGEEYCYTNYHWEMEQGVAMLNQAIAMIGLKPQQYP
jgi:hypothetical protein